MADLPQAPDNQGGPSITGSNQRGRPSPTGGRRDYRRMPSPGCARRRTSDVQPRFLLDCPHGAESRLTVKKAMPIDSNTFIWNRRNAARDVAPAPALPANACTTPGETYPVTCSISGLTGGSLSQIVTTQVTRPGKQGTPGDCFPSSLGLLTRPGK